MNKNSHLSTSGVLWTNSRVIGIEAIEAGKEREQAFGKQFQRQGNSNEKRRRTAAGIRGFKKARQTVKCASIDRTDAQ
jgi:hypothetical protein